jgi:putative peptidoglycan lipid II flippase
MIGITALGIVLAEDVTRLLFGYGSLSESALELTAATLAVFLLGLTAHSMIAVLARAFYAMQDTATPVAAALFAVVVDIVVASVLVAPFGVRGLAAAIAIGAWFELLTLAVLMRRRVPNLEFRHVLLVAGKTLVVSVAGGLAAWFVYSTLLGAWGEDPGVLLLLVRATAATLAGGAVILLGAFALRIEELRTIVGIVVDLLRRKGRA